MFRNSKIGFPLCQKSSIGAADIVTMGFNPWIRYGMNGESPIGTAATDEGYIGHSVPTAGDPTGFGEVYLLRPSVETFGY